MQIKTILSGPPNLEDYEPNSRNTVSVEFFYTDAYGGPSFFSVTKGEILIPTPIESWLNTIDNNGTFIIKNIRHGGAEENRK